MPRADVMSKYFHHCARSDSFSSIWICNKKLRDLPDAGRGADCNKFSVMIYSAAGASVAVSATGASPAGASAVAAAFLERRVRVAFFLVLAMFSS